MAKFIQPSVQGNKIGSTNDVVNVDNVILFSYGEDKTALGGKATGYKITFTFYSQTHIWLYSQEQKAEYEQDLKKLQTLFV